MDLAYGPAHGDEWRWKPERHRIPITYSISVYELAETPEPPKGAKKVPFGFSPRVFDPAPPRSDEWIDWLEVCG